MNNQNEPRRSRRLSTIIPASHWMSIGYLQREAEAMENLMIDMDGHCEKGVDDAVELRSRYAGMPLLWASQQGATHDQLSNLHV